MESSSILKHKLDQFTNQQVSLGISLQAFKQKFVFNQNSGPDAIFLEFNTPSLSQKLGMKSKQQNICILVMSQMIFKAGQVLKLPITTTIVALNLAQYYFTGKSFVQFDFRDICIGSVFLACKSQQTLRRSYQVAIAFDYIFKTYQGFKNIKQLQLDSAQYLYIKQKVTKIQNEILFQLGFQAHKLFDIPHRYISGLISSFNKHQKTNQIVQNTWSFLNDIYRTKAPLYYPSQIIAAAAVFMSLQKLQISLPEKPWWILMESSIVNIQNIIYLTNEIYQISKNNDANFNKVSDILQRVGKKQLKISNLFPVPYYRKINLDKNNLLKKSIEELHQNKQYINQKQYGIQTQQNKQKDSLYPNTFNHKQKSSITEKNGNSYQKSKKQKKKHKKKSKQQKNERQSRSISQQASFNAKKGKYQNDDQTPLVDRKASFDSLKIIKAQAKNAQHINRKIRQQIISLAQDGLKNQSINQKREQIARREQDSSNMYVKPVLFDAKSMLSKITQQIKKMQVKNDKLALSSLKCFDKVDQKDKNKQAKIMNENNTEMRNKNIEQIKQKICVDFEIQKSLNQHQRSSSSQQQQDQLMAELIKIKKKNLQKKDQKN